LNSLVNVYMDKPATELCYAEEKDLVEITRGILSLTLLCRGKGSHDAISKIDRIRHVDAVFDDPFLLDQLFRAGSIPELAEHVLLDRL